ncbi:carboxylate-amine ligase [Streptomyces flavofungini]|uniref:carboxylate-amine ligase n=1 Tax=Streptomyces flavofungini TaxID=68200 RepID=UPI0034E04219
MPSEADARTGAAESAPLTVGVEEEYLLVDPVTRQVSPRAHEVVADAAALLGPRVTTELTRFQVEVRSDPHTVLADLGEQLRHLRTVVARCALRHGVRIISSGSPVLAPPLPPPITEGARYARSVERFRALDDEQSACACHVHIGVPDPAQALLLSNHLRPWLPVLISLSANSPYWAGRSTGYASWRTMVWARWPAAGPPPYFASPAHFEDLVGDLTASGAVMDRGGLYWDIRPSHHVPTLEVRVADAAQTVDDTLLFAAVVRALAADARDAVAAGTSAPRPAAELLRAACWRAARDGLAGQGIDLSTARPVPAADLARRLLDRIAPVLARHGDLDLVRRGFALLLSRGDGAERQRAAQRHGGGLHRVVDHLIVAAAGDWPVNSNT